MKSIFYKSGKANMVFFTGEDGQDFNIKNSNGIKQLDKVKQNLNLKDIGYNIQIHSDIINTYCGNIQNGDAIFTDKLQVGVGVFTADCVPVLIYDKEKEVCAAVHSGWKGTYAHITEKTINLLANQYGSKPKDIQVFIGPHIMTCCYEVSKELKDKFLEDNIYDGYNIFNGYNLNLEECIRAQCINIGVNIEDIISTKICTYCNKEYKLHSYRKDGENSGRMFSMIYIDK